MRFLKGGLNPKQESFAAGLNLGDIGKE